MKNIPDVSFSLIFENILRGLTLYSLKQKQILNWLELLFNKNKLLVIEALKINENVKNLIKISNFADTILRKIHMFNGKCNLLIKKEEKKPEKTEDLQKIIKKKLPLIKITMKKPTKTKLINKKIKKNLKEIKPKKKKHQKNEIQTSESLSEHSFNQISLKPLQKDNVKFSNLIELIY